MVTFRRLLSFLGPYKRGNIASLVLASMAMGVTVLIPLLVGKAIDAVQAGDKADILPWVLAIVGAGILRLALTRRAPDRSPARSRSRSSSTCARASTGTCRRSSSASSTASRPGS